MDAFDRYEIKGRSKALEALKQLEAKGWFIEEPRPEAKTRYDFIAHKDGKKILIEAKDRYYRYGAFPDWQIDGNKILALRGLMKADSSIKAIYYLNTFPEGHYAFWDISKNIGEWRTSKPHYLKTAVDSETVCTYDLFLSLDEAIKTE